MEAASEQMHSLADTTYRNTEELVTDLRALVAAAKNYHRSMQMVMSASKSFYVVMENIGAKASNLPGSVRKLGDCMQEMVGGYKQIFRHYSEVATSMNSDFIVPLETKLDTEEKDHSRLHKMYRHDAGKRQMMVDKASKKLESIHKKKRPSREQLEKEAQLKQVLVDCKEELHSTRVEGLRKALIEERKLYCFVVDRFCSVIHNEIAVNALSHRTLSSKVTEWTTLCSSPAVLPPESAALLANPRAPRAFPLSTSGERQAWYNPPEASSPRHNGAVSILRGQGSGNEGARQRRVSCRMRALYPHQSSTNSQLEFTTGDFIDAVDDAKDGWLFGKNSRTDRSGWFPVQYVDKIWPTPEPQRRQRREEVRDGPSSIGSSGGGQHNPSPIPDRDYGPSFPHTHAATLPLPTRPGSAGSAHSQGYPANHMGRKTSGASVMSGHGHPNYRQ